MQSQAKRFLKILSPKQYLFAVGKIDRFDKVYATREALMFRCLMLLLVFISGQTLYGQTLHITDKHSPDKEAVIADLLSLQQTWQIDIREKQPLQLAQNGFLFVRMKPEFIRDLIDNKNATIIWASCDETFAGYLILTEITEFFDLYRDSPIRTFDCLMPQGLFEKYLMANNVKYIEQIAVNRSLTHAGIGTALMNEAKGLSPKGLVAAVITQPIRNQASLEFFAGHTFAVMGHLNCVECLEWPAYQTRVFFWAP